MIDYFNLINAKGGVNGVKISYEECVRTLARYRNRVDQPSLEVDERLAADVVDNMEAASGLFVRQATERNFDGGGREFAFEHGRPPTLERLLR